MIYIDHITMLERTIQNLADSEAMLETAPESTALKMVLREHQMEIENALTASHRLKQNIELALKLKPQPDNYSIIATHYLKTPKQNT